VKLTGSKKAAAAGGGILTAAVLLGAEAWRQHNDRVAQAEARIKGMKAALESAATPQQAALAWLQEYAAEHDDFGAVLAGLTGDEMREFAASIAGQGELSAETRAKIDDLAGSHLLAATAINKMTEEFDAAEQAVENQKTVTGELNARNAEAARIYGEMASGMRDAGGAADGLGGSINRMEPPAKNLADAISDVNSELAEFFGSIQSAEEAEADFQKALDDASDSIQENGKRLGTNTDRQRANLAARGRVIDSIEGMVKSMMEEGRGADEIVAKSASMIKAYEDTLVAAGLTRAEAEEYTAALGDIPAEVQTTLELEGYDAALSYTQTLQTELDRLERVYRPRVEVSSSGGSSGGGTTTAEDEGLPEDWVPASRSARKSRSFRSTGMDKNEGSSPTHITLVMPDGKVLADLVVDESERRGGLPLLVRPGR
jgi:chromosome segregation ATPase